MARDLEQPYDPFEASLHELRGALVDLDGDGRPDATMPIPPAAKAIQYIDDKLAPHFPDESRSGNAMQVAQGGPVMTDAGQPQNAMTGSLGDRSIDLSRPKLQNADGSFSTERTIGIEQDGRYFNIPTIVDGVQRTEDEAVRLFNEGKNPAVGEFASQAEADAAAPMRSERIGQLRGQPPSRPPQQNAMMRYLSNSADALGRIPGDLWKLVPEAQPNEGGEPSQDMWGSIANSPAGEFVGNVAHALGSGLPAVGSGLPRISAVAGPAIKSLTNSVGRSFRSMTPAGREANAMADELSRVSVRNHRLSSSLEDAGRSLPPRPLGPEPTDIRGQLTREKQYSNTLRTHDSLQRNAVDTARRSLEESNSTPYARMRDPRTGRFIKKSDEIAIREQQLQIAERGGASWDMETADRTFDAASRSLRGFRQAVAGRNFEQASELISRQTGVPVDQVMPSLVRWSRGR